MRSKIGGGKRVNRAPSHTSGPVVTPVYLPNIGPTSDLGLVNVNTLSDLAGLSDFTISWRTCSRTSPIKVNHFDMTTHFGSAIGPDPSSGHGYSFFVWANTVLVNSGQAIFATWQPAQPYPDGSIIDGVPGSNDGTDYTGGAGGSGGAGGGGGGTDSVGVNGWPQANGSLIGGNGVAGSFRAPAGANDFPGAAGRGTGSADLAGSPWTPGAVGGDDGFGHASTKAGIGAGGFSGEDNIVGLTPGEAGGGGAGGAYIAIVCRDFQGDPAATGIFTTGGNGADGNISLESAAGGGGLIEIFAIKYGSGVAGSGPVVQVTGGGTGSLGTPAGAGGIILYELNSAGTAILAVHTDPTDSWNNL